MTPNQHPWRRLVGLTDPRATEVKIECLCGHVSAGPTFVAAMAAHHRHQGLAPQAPAQKAT